MIRWYTLVGTVPVATSPEDAEALFSDLDARRVAYTEVAEGVEVSTVFLVLDHQHGAGPPLLFETIVFWPTSSMDNEMERCGTWKEAEQMHGAMVERVRHALESLRTP